MKRLSVLGTACFVFVFCAATAIASPAQILTTLHSFAGYPDDGANPDAGLVQASDGNFYGTTAVGGANNHCARGSCGTVFKITPSGTLTTLYSFVGYPNDGAYPEAELVQARDGNFYGTTYGGGANYYGTVFKITASGVLTTLHSFNGDDGYYTYAGLVQASDGNFYGTTYFGGAHDSGTVFKSTPSGVLTTLYSFCSQNNCSDGYYPYAGLVLASDGDFYGTTLGGTNHWGTVFKITPSGSMTTLHTFVGHPSDGGYPAAGLVQASDGNFYGATRYGGVNDQGTVFKITPSGALTTLYSFCSQRNCTDGEQPSAGLVQASDGNFYGTTLGGGANGYGTVFKITASGALTTLYGLCSQTNCSDGANPYAALVQASDGNLYGTTSSGGNYGGYCNPYGCGTVFRLVLTRPCIVCRNTE